MTFHEFTSNDLIIDAVIRNLEIIGEAAKNIPQKVRNNHPKKPWRQMMGLRNYVAHEYFGIDFENIWKIITDDLPSNFNDLTLVIGEEKNNKN